MDHTKELIIKSQEGDKNSRDALVEENMGLVYTSARKYIYRGYEMEDLIQIGVIGLIKAIDRFDVAMEVAFSTYAVIMIVGEIKRFLRDDGLVKISRSIKENGIKLKAANENLSKKLMREPTIQELQEETQILIEDIVIAQESMKEVESIHKTIYQSDGNEIYLIDKLTHKEDEKEKVLNRLLVGKLIAGLALEEQRIINKRYFENKTQTQVAKELGLTQVQVSRLEKKILGKLRSVI